MQRHQRSWLGLRRYLCMLNRKAKQNRLGTFLQEGIDGCAKILENGDHRRQKLMVIVSDGQPNKCDISGCLTSVMGFR